MEYAKFRVVHFPLLCQVSQIILWYPFKSPVSQTLFSVISATHNLKIVIVITPF